MSARAKEFRQSNGLLNDGQALRRRIGEDGYLFFRKLLAGDQVWSLRLQILNLWGGTAAGSRPSFR